MKYIITITKVEETTVAEEGAYTIVDKRPWTKAEIDGQNFFGTSPDKWLEDNPLKEVRGYAPTRPVTKKVDTEVLKQTVDTLDLAAVIKAVNGL